jgi:hypothetical protein
MWFRNAFLALVLGFAASFWLTVPAPAAHVGAEAAQVAQVAQVAQLALDAAATFSDGSPANALEAGGKVSGEADEIGYGPLPEGDGPSRTAAAPDGSSWPSRDLSLPVPHRPPAFA